MSNRQFTLTIKACEILESVPKRSRSKFVSDAIVAYGKKKNVLDEYATSGRAAPIKKPNSESPGKSEVTLANSGDTEVTLDDQLTPKKVNIDSGY